MILKKRMNRKFLLDTNICVFFLRGKYEIDERIESVGLDNCCISSITVAELKYGAELMRRKGRNFPPQDLDAFINAIDVVSIDSALDVFAEEKTRLQLMGTPADDNFDLLIGATAIVNKYVLVTENVSDFINLRNIEIENWIIR